MSLSSALIRFFNIGFEVRPLFASIWDISSPKARQSHVENNNGSLKTAK
jgi:hypothetical protein